MAERFRGLVPSQTQAWAFRGRMMFDESADEILSLDVKKRHCELPKKARNNLKAIMSTYLAKSAEAWRIAGRRVEQQKKESREDIANRSIAQTPVSRLDYAPGSDLSSPTAVAERREQQQEIEKETIGAIQDRSVTPATLDQKVRDDSFVAEVQGLKGNAMWLPYPAVQLGKAETLVNKAHSWVAVAYAASEKQPGIVPVLHQLFTILARAELEVRSHTWSGVSPEVAGRVLENFRRKAAAIGEELADQLSAVLEEIMQIETDES